MHDILTVLLLPDECVFSFSSSFFFLCFFPVLSFRVINSLLCATNPNAKARFQAIPIRLDDFKYLKRRQTLRGTFSKSRLGKSFGSTIKKKSAFRIQFDKFESTYIFFSSSGMLFKKRKNGFVPKRPNSTGKQRGTKTITCRGQKRIMHARLCLKHNNEDPNNYVPNR